MDKPGTIHPHRKSFGHYVQRGYSFAAGRSIPEEVRISVEEASKLDTAILIIDDILDDSAMRAGRPSLPKAIGVKHAIVSAMLLQSAAVKHLSQAMQLVKTPTQYRVQVLELVNEFQNYMYEGQTIDLSLRKEVQWQPAMLEKYFRMIYCITACHVRIGIEAGQLIAGSEPDSVVSEIADSIGMIRQMVDDFNDYFDEHHEPFGDFRGGLNRLPEILFKREGGNRADVLRLLEKGQHSEARRLVLTESVRKSMYDFCKAEQSKAESKETAFNYQDLLEDIGSILSTPVI